MESNKKRQKSKESNKKLLTGKKKMLKRIRIQQQQKGVEMTQYKINYKKGGYKPGEEIQPEKVTTAEKVGNAVLKALYFYIAALFIFNLIRFIM